VRGARAAFAECKRCSGVHTKGWKILPLGGEKEHTAQKGAGWGVEIKHRRPVYLTSSHASFGMARG